MCIGDVGNSTAVMIHPLLVENVSEWFTVFIVDFFKTNAYNKVFIPHLKNHNLGYVVDKRHRGFISIM